MWVGRVFLGKCEDFSKIWVSTLLHRLRPVVSWFMTEDYPRPIMELERCFPDESSCRTYLSALRWPDGFVCPCCGGRQGISIRRDLLRCTACRHEASATAGTIFQDSKLPLTVWFRAMWQMASQKNGISAMGLQKSSGYPDLFKNRGLGCGPLEPPQAACAGPSRPLGLVGSRR